MVKQCGLIFMMIVTVGLAVGCGDDTYDITAVTGATKVVLAKRAPSEITLTVTGMVKQEYRFTGDAFNALATARVRTREVSSEGKFLGAYRYTGVPVYNILNGIAPAKPADAAFDRPLDMVVTFTNRSGRSVHFSYGELTMSDDCSPVMLAFHREEIKPTKNSDEYDKNIFTESITGLRLICPREPDTERYLDEVVTMTFQIPKTPDAMLPVMKKGTTCSAESLSCIRDGKASTAVYSGVKVQRVAHWIRVGHGRGYKGIDSAEGYNLRSFLTKNFNGCGDDDFFMFIACDGYRVLLSGREIFSTDDGDSFMLLKSLNGKKPVGNNMLAPVKDYFVDRDVWGLSHIVLIRGFGHK
jgi:hypothetical protein